MSWSEFSAGPDIENRVARVIAALDAAARFSARIVRVIERLHAYTPMVLVSWKRTVYKRCVAQEEYLSAISNDLALAWHRQDARHVLVYLWQAIENLCPQKSMYVWGALLWRFWSICRQYIEYRRVLKLREALKLRWT